MAYAILMPTVCLWLPRIITEIMGKDVEPTTYGAIYRSLLNPPYLVLSVRRLIEL